MKKFYTLLCILAVSLSGYAQVPVATYPAQGFRSFPAKQKVSKSGKHRLQGVELGENQYLVGNCYDDEYGSYGYIQDVTGMIEVGSVIYDEMYHSLKNPKILGLRFCHYQPVDMYRVTVYDQEIELETALVSKEVKRSHEGWNYIPFDEPVDLIPGGVYIAYAYDQKEDEYPICNWPDSYMGGYYAYAYVPERDKYVWMDFSGYAGALCIQLVVQADEPLPDYDLSLEEPWSYGVSVGQETNCNVYLISNSGKEISNIDYAITIDENRKEYHAEFPTPMESGLYRQRYLGFPFTAPDNAGMANALLEITKANGQELSPSPSTEFSFPVMTRAAHHTAVVEEYTGTGCGWCPRGWVGMEYLSTHYPNDCAVIAVHQYNSNDPMYTKKYAQLPFAGAPSCMIDRSSGSIDPYFGTGGERGIIDDFEFYQSIAPTVDVSVTASFTDSNLKKIAAKSNLEYLIDTGKYTIAYAVTANNLSSKKAQWRQTNYYNGAESDEGLIPEMPDLAEFAHGIYAQGGVPLVFNDVLVTSSYTTTGSNGARSLPSSPKAGDIVEHSYTLTLPTTTSAPDLMAVLQHDKLYVTAIVIDSDGYITNAARCHVEFPEGIDTVLAPATDDNAVYNLQGQKVNEMKRGINVVGGKKVLK